MAVVAVPLLVVTDMGPVVAPEGTTAVRLLKVIPVGVAAVTPLNLTVGVPALRLAPEIVTPVPTPPKPGEKPVTVG